MENSYSLVSTKDTLRLLLLLFALQHFIFIGARIAFWIFISIFCLGCACVDGDVVPMPQCEHANHEYDPIGNQVVSFYYEQWIESDRNLQDRGTLAEQRIHAQQLSALRADPDFLAASQAARPG